MVGILSHCIACNQDIRWRTLTLALALTLTLTHAGALVTYLLRQSGAVGGGDDGDGGGSGVAVPANEASRKPSSRSLLSNAGGFKG